MKTIENKWMRAAITRIIYPLQYWNRLLLVLIKRKHSELYRKKQRRG